MECVYKPYLKYTFKMCYLLSKYYGYQSTWLWLVTGYIVTEGYVFSVSLKAMFTQIKDDLSVYFLGAMVLVGLLNPISTGKRFKHYDNA